MSFILGLGFVVLVWFAIKTFAKMEPRVVVNVVRKTGGVLAFAAAAFLMFRGRIDMAILLGYAGLSLFGYGAFGLPSLWQRTRKSTGATSRVRSATVEMELDHDTGAMRGMVLAGIHEGRGLDTLNRDELNTLLMDCAANDPDGARLLEAYFDRRFPGWRKDAQMHADPGPRGETRSGAMTEQEAHEVLGLQPGASGDEIRRAHRTLMKKLHPDQGGSTYLAARVNQAKDILLARHR